MKPDTIVSVASTLGFVFGAICFSVIRAVYLDPRFIDLGIHEDLTLPLLSAFLGSMIPLLVATRRGIAGKRAWTAYGKGMAVLLGIFVVILFAIPPDA